MRVLPDDAHSLDAIAHRLMMTRLAYKLNQKQFCERAGIKTNTYNQYEKAKQRISLDFAIQLCEAYGLTLDWIYRGDPSGLKLQLARDLEVQAS